MLILIKQKFINLMSDQNNNHNHSQVLNSFKPIPNDSPTEWSDWPACVTRALTEEPRHAGVPDWVTGMLGCVHLQPQGAPRRMGGRGLRHVLLARTGPVGVYHGAT